VAFDAINLAKLHVQNHPECANNSPSKFELEKMSINYREEGDEFFKQGNYEYAFNVYSRSIASAPEGPIAALAYANR
jgi:hypothetical protein